MKLLTVCLCLIAVLAALAVYNVATLNGLAGESMSYIDRAAGLAAEEKFDEAAAELEALSALWQQKHSVIAMFMNHGAASDISDALIRAEQYARHSEKPGLFSELASAKKQIENIARSDLPILENVF